MGRPPLPLEKKRQHDLRVRLTEAEREVIERAATHDGLATSTWVRHIILQAARERLDGRRQR